MAVTIKIGIDFGTTNSFAAFLHGDTVAPLIPNRAFGIPSVFYYDGKGTSYVGAAAQKRAERHPENAVYSVKRRLAEKSFAAGGKNFTPKEIVREILTYVVHSAETLLEQDYLEQYDMLEAVICIPVDFTEPMKHLILEAAQEVLLMNGQRLRVTGLIEEPVAAAVEYFGTRTERDLDILVVDIGGGTTDVSLVHANCAAGQAPYEVISHRGRRQLGGDEYDAKVGAWIGEEHQRAFGCEPSPREQSFDFLREGRRIKEELTEREEVVYPITAKAGDMDVSIDRAAFHRLTVELTQGVLDCVREALDDPAARNRTVTRVALTGGSCLMPVIEESLRASSLFPAGCDFKKFEPEHAIAYGAARYAASRVYNRAGCPAAVPAQPPMIEMTSAKAYGILYTDDENKQDYVYIIIPRGAKLPYTGTTGSKTRSENQWISTFSVFEVDTERGVGFRIQPLTGEEIEIMTAELNRKGTVTRVPKGTTTEESLTLTEDGILKIEVTDKVSGKVIRHSSEKSVQITRMI